VPPPPLFSNNDNIQHSHLSKRTFDVKRKGLAPNSRSDPPTANSKQSRASLEYYALVTMGNNASDSSGKQQYQQLRCDCCDNLITEDNHIQNNPCDHIVCTLCVVTSNMKWGANPACCQVKDCPHKYTASCQYFNHGNPGKVIENEVAIIDKVCTDSDVLADVFAYLVPKEIMSLRRVCKLWREAAKLTIVPPDNTFAVKTIDEYNAVSVVATALPNLQGFELFDIDRRRRHKYSDGEDPNEEEAARTANLTSLDIEIISNFSKLRHLTLYGAGLNGRYPFLFNFPMLQKLSIIECGYLKWDLGMLAGLPLLKELWCNENDCMTGNINSLRVLKDTLETLVIFGCQNIEGNFMDLADFPHLKELHLTFTAVTGDIRDIGENDFSALENLIFEGGHWHELQRISDAPEIVRTLYLLKKQRPKLKIEDHWYDYVLSRDSPDWYFSVGGLDKAPPFSIRFVEAGPRIGYRWEQEDSLKPMRCEVNWLDPEPDRESSEYTDYIEKLQRIESEMEAHNQMYRGLHQPPTFWEYHRLWIE
jgi:hypothetical protein